MAGDARAARSWLQPVPPTPRRGRHHPFPYPPSPNYRHSLSYLKFYLFHYFLPKLTKISGENVVIVRRRGTVSRRGGRRIDARPLHFQQLFLGIFYPVVEFLVRLE